MKIHMSNSQIDLTDTVNTDTDIPLAYLSENEKSYTASSLPLQKEIGISKIIPYTYFEDYNQIFFKALNFNPKDYNDLVKIDSASYLHRVKDLYQYIPEASTKFKPFHFHYSVIGQRQIRYTPNTIYNLKIACVEQKDKIKNALIEIFSDAPDKGLCPSNVWVNGKNLSSTSLNLGPTETIADKDFVFIESEDGTYFESTKETIPYMDYLNKHTNVWVCLSNLETLTTGTAILKSATLYDKQVTCDHYTFIDGAFPHANFPKTLQTLYLFDGNALAAEIKVYEGKGIIIATAKDLILNAKHYYQMIYELLMHCYSISFKESITYESYICDYPVDYEVRFGRLSEHEGFRTSAPYYELLDSIYEDDYKFCSINLDTELIEWEYLKDYIFFKKKEPVGDLKKPTNALSIYLDTHEIAYFLEWHYALNSLPKLNFLANHETLTVEIPAFSYSDLGIYKTQKETIELPLKQIIDYHPQWIDTIHYIVYYDKGILKFEEESFYKQQGDPLYNIYISLEQQPITVFDMRRRGGGLPLDYENDYNLFDIGHIEGRPVRKSGALLIYLPLTLKPYHEILEKIVRQHTTSEKYPILIYED